MAAPTRQTLGPYQILQQIGKGGMAVVLKAYAPEQQRQVALKVLPPSCAADPKFVARFAQEAQAAMRLKHPRILAAEDYGQANGLIYLVMQYVGNGTLADLMKQGPLPLPRIQQIVAEVAEALDFAHAQGVLHRDIKPSNILLDEAGHCLLADFGLAKIQEASAQITSAGTIIGTPAYMSPEQGLGQPATPASDIYALGVVLYELATGRLPFTAETPMGVVLMHLYDPLPLPRTLQPDLPEAVEAVILKTLAKEPGDRFATAGELARALAMAIETGQSPVPLPPRTPNPMDSAPTQRLPSAQPAWRSALAHLPWPKIQIDRAKSYAREVGLLAGALLVAVLYGPFMSLPILSSARQPIGADYWRAAAMSGATALLVLLVTGGFVGWRSRSRREAAMRGATMGGLAGLIVYLVGGAPVAGIFSAAPMILALPGPMASPDEFARLVATTVAQVIAGVSLAWLACLAVGAGLGALGAVLAQLKPASAEPLGTDEHWWRTMVGVIVNAEIALVLTTVIYALLVPAIRKTSPGVEATLPPLLRLILDWVPWLSPLTMLYGALALAAFSTRWALPATPKARRAVAWLAFTAGLCPWAVIINQLRLAALASDAQLLLLSATIVPSLILFAFAGRAWRAAGFWGQAELATFAGVIGASFNNAWSGLLVTASPLLSVPLAIVLLVVVLLTRLSPGSEGSPSLSFLTAYTTVQPVFGIALGLVLWAGWFFGMLIVRLVQIPWNWITESDTE